MAAASSATRSRRSMFSSIDSRRLDQRGAPLDQRRQPHRRQVVALGGLDGPVGPARPPRPPGWSSIASWASTPRAAASVGCRRAASRSRSSAADAAAALVVAPVLPVEADEQAQRLGPALDVTGPLGRRLQAAGVLDGVVVQAGQPGRAGGGRPQLQVAVGLGQPELGQLERLVARPDGRGSGARRPEPGRSSRRAGRRGGRGGPSPRGRSCPSGAAASRAASWMRRCSRPSSRPSIASRARSWRNPNTSGVGLHQEAAGDEARAARR